MKPIRDVARWLGYDLIRRTKHATVESHVATLLSKLEADLVLDVGANIGQYGRGLRKAGYTGRILSFEPAPEPFGRLEEASHGDPAWDVVPYALGSQAGTAHLNVMRGSELSSFWTPNDYAKGLHPDWNVTQTVEVPVRTLDDFLGKTSSCKSFLKMDTQGFDLEVLRGARRSLPAILGLQSEISVVPTYDGMPDYVDALTTFRDHGFIVTGFYPVSRDPTTLAVIEFDCIMRRTA